MGFGIISLLFFIAVFVLGMAALSADRDTKYQEGVEVSVPVAASTLIYAGSGVTTNATGYAVEAVNTASFLTAGVALEQVDNSSGSDGDKSITVRRKGVFQFTASGMTQADIGKTVYWTDGGSVTLTAGNGVVAGVIAWVESATSVWVDIDQR